MAVGGLERPARSAPSARGGSAGNARRRSPARSRAAGNGCRRRGRAANSRSGSSRCRPRPAHRIERVLEGEAGQRQASGAHSSAARCELAPGAPWNATARAGSAAAAARIVSTIARAGAGNLSMGARGYRRGGRRTSDFRTCAAEPSTLERRANRNIWQKSSRWTTASIPSPAGSCSRASSRSACRSAAACISEADKPHRPHEMGFAIEGVVEEGAAEEGPALATLLATGRRGQGRGSFAKCTACHTIEQGGANGIGPNLYGVIGKPIGKHAAGFAYSSDLAGHGGDWNFENMDAWLRPQGVRAGHQDDLRRPRQRRGPRQHHGLSAAEWRRPALCRRLRPPSRGRGRGRRRRGGGRRRGRRAGADAAGAAAMPGAAAAGNAATANE